MLNIQLLGKYISLFFQSSVYFLLSRELYV